MKISDVGLDLIKKFEGVRLMAYKALPHERYYTIGYGHYGADVKQGQKITLDRANELLERDIDKFEKLVNKYNHIYNFNQNEFDALCSFCYNVGNIDGLTKNGTRTRKEIEQAFTLYVKANNLVITGLVKRRNAELALFKTPVASTNRCVTLKETQKIKALIDKIIGGEFGNGDERKEVLYNSIQKLVNDRLK